MDVVGRRGSSMSRRIPEPGLIAQICRRNQAFVIIDDEQSLLPNPIWTG
jgi:hypothetical protein